MVNFFGVRGDEGYLRSPAQERPGGAVKIFSGDPLAIGAHGLADTAQKTAKNACSLHNIPYATLRMIIYP